MRTPADFVVTRHLVTHPGESAGEIQKHCQTPGASPPLRLSTVSRALGRVLAETDGVPELLFRRLLTHPQRYRHRSVGLAVAGAVNTWEMWHPKAPVPHWLSGEFAAVAIDGRPIVPERCLIYVAEAHMDQAVRSIVRDHFAAIAPTSAANFVVRAADPWLHLETGPDGTIYVEKGQRELDYWDSKHLALAGRFKS